jgi:3-methyladenine DNA glycosylase Tag
MPTVSLGWAKWEEKFSEGLMADSGLVNVRTRILRARLRLSSAAEALQMIQQAFGAYRAVVADLTKESKAEAWAEVPDCLKEFETSSGFATELELAICAGAKTA